MKSSLTFLLSIMAVALIAFPTTADAGCGNGRGKGCGNGGGGKGQGAGSCSISDLPREDLSDAETASLLLMREEEKLARDVYLTLGKQYDVNVFQNIPQAEQRHMDKVGELLAKYEITDPVTDDTVGKFESAKMQELYDTLVDQGSASLTAALQVGATIEDLDIFDLEKAMAEDVDNEDIKLVYQNLTKGSRNHMRAFTAQLEANGASYEVQYISAADYAAIVDSEWERGPVDANGISQGKGCGNGKGNGKGKGKGQSQGQGRGRGCNNG